MSHQWDGPDGLEFAATRPAAVVANRFGGRSTPVGGGRDS